MSLPVLKAAPAPRGHGWVGTEGPSPGATELAQFSGEGADPADTRKAAHEHPSACPRAAATPAPHCAVRSHSSLPGGAKRQRFSSRGQPVSSRGVGSAGSHHPQGQERGDGPAGGLAAAPWRPLGELRRVAPAFAVGCGAGGLDSSGKLSLDSWSSPCTRPRNLDANNDRARLFP